jgi:hypothetical protein
MTDPKYAEASGSTPRNLSSAESPSSLLKAATLRAGLEEAKAQVHEGTDAVRSSLSSAAEQAKAQAADIASQAKQRAYDIAEEQKQVGAEGIGGVARAVRTAANELEDTAPRIARYVQDAASTIDRLSSDLKEKSVDDLIGTVEHFARTQPVAFFGGAVLTGFVLARFIKSSAERRSAHEQDFGAAAGPQRLGERSVHGMGPTRGGGGNQRRAATEFGPTSDSRNERPGLSQPAGGAEKSLGRSAMSRGVVASSG